jgi:3-oxoacyl-[acyl-carrier protein] reductase
MQGDTDFSGKHILVVGGSSGIGNGIAHGCLGNSSLGIGL